MMMVMMMKMKKKEPTARNGTLWDLVFEAQTGGSFFWLPSLLVTALLPSDCPSCFCHSFPVSNSTFFTRNTHAYLAHMLLPIDPSPWHSDFGSPGAMDWMASRSVCNSSFSHLWHGFADFSIVSVLAGTSTLFTMDKMGTRSSRSNLETRRSTSEGCNTSSSNLTTKSRTKRGLQTNPNMNNEASIEKEEKICAYCCFSESGRITSISAGRQKQTQTKQRKPCKQRNMHLYL